MNVTFPDCESDDQSSSEISAPSNGIAYQEKHLDYLKRTKPTRSPSPRTHDETDDEDNTDEVFNQNRSDSNAGQ